MSSDDYFEPDFWTLTGASPVVQTLPAPPRKMRPRQPTFVGVPKKQRPTSIWRMVARMEAELIGAARCPKA